MKRTGIIIGAAIAVIAVACARPANAADMAKAKKNYDMVCASCHGIDGGGNGPAAATLSRKPRNFTDCAAMAKIPDSTLLGVIKNGGASYHLGATMQPWGSAFSKKQIGGLVAYVRHFCNK